MSALARIRHKDRRAGCPALRQAGRLPPHGDDVLRLTGHPYGVLDKWLYWVSYKQVTPDGVCRNLKPRRRSRQFTRHRVC